MLEAIRNLGGLALSENPDDYLSSLYKAIPKVRNKKQQHIMEISFDSRRESVSLTGKEIDETTQSDYIWIGNADGAMSPQWYFTTTNVEYLLSQTIPNYIDMLDEGDYKDKFKEILNKFYVDLGEQSGIKNRYRYVLDLEKFGIADSGWLDSTYQSVGKDPKKMVKEVKKKFIDWMKIETPYAENEIYLYTLLIDGRVLARESKYLDLVSKKKVGSIFEAAKKGTCSVCGRENSVTDDTTKFTMKYYMTDKIGFSSGISGNFIKNFPICKECYTKILVGEAYLSNHMRTSIGGLRLYIIPDLIFKPDMGLFNIDEWAIYIKDSFNSAVSKEGMEKFERSLNQYLDYEQSKNNYILSLLFFEKNQAEFKVLKLIKDVPPSRLDIIKKSFSDAAKVMGGILGQDKRWNIDLEKIYYLIPLKKSQRSLEYRKLLELYDSIFSGKMVSYDFLIKQAVQLCGVYYFDEFGQYNVKLLNGTSWDIALSYVMIQENLLMDGLRRLGVLKKGGKRMDYDSLNVDKGTKNYFIEMGYDEPKAALFLLGNQIGAVASEQWRHNMKNKPILNKLNYQGMSWNKIQRLVGELTEKMRQYNVLGYNESRLAECMRLMDMGKAMNKGRWPLSDSENIYYIISGYGYETAKIMYKSKEINNEEEDVNE